eukprot:Sspe_Gene.99546::Locus_73179_Transcript_1_1_Confidence_1.000_Length_2081::g.99546::m.99546/K01206/FUCA; alpha-L-fucosidase
MVKTFAGLLPPPLLLLLLPLSFRAVDGGECTFKLPDGDGCEEYDLAPLRNPGGHSAGGFVIAMCTDVSPTALPPACAGSPRAPGYLVERGACYAIGNLSITYHGVLNTGYDIPADWSPHQQSGIKVSYNQGTGGRRMVVKVVCSTESASPTFAGEDPPLQYNFLWPHPAACSPKRLSSPCPITYKPSWDSLLMRPRPAWYDDAKFGIFIHWGVFSVPAYRTEWYWHNLRGGKWGNVTASPQADTVNFHNQNFGCSGIEPEKYPCTGPKFDYADFAPMFRAELFNPSDWADLFRRAGAKYVVLTSKHHEGWCNWPSAQHWNWNSGENGPFRDLVGDLARSVRGANLTFGVYHSLREWYHPLYLADNDNNCTDPRFVPEVLLPTLEDLVTRYSPDIVWADGSGDAPCTHVSDSYWRAPDFISWLYNRAANRDRVVVNDRWGTGSGGDYRTGGDRFTPSGVPSYKYESCFTIQHSSWGFDRTENITQFYSTEDLVSQLVRVVSTGGNLLLNVGPTADGRIAVAFQERLLGIGTWLKYNGEAIYNTRPWRYSNDTAQGDIWYTASKLSPVLYAISFTWPKMSARHQLNLTKLDPSEVVKVDLLGYPDAPVAFRPGPVPSTTTLTLPPLGPADMVSSTAWSFRITLKHL